MIIQCSDYVAFIDIWKGQLVLYSYIVKLIDDDFVKQTEFLIWQQHCLSLLDDFDLCIETLLCIVMGIYHKDDLYYSFTTEVGLIRKSYISFY